MKKIALLGLLFLSQLSFSQKAQNFESKITFQKTNPEGCLNFYYGPFPEETFTPECRGREEQIFTASRYNTYSNVNVSAGVAYTFITYSEYNNLKTAFITISNEEGTEVYASGTDRITWTSTKDEVVRFYVHPDNQCGDSDESVKKYILCGAVPPEPTYGCDQSYNGPFWVACSVSGEAGYLTADDFFVPKDSEAFKLNSLKFLLVPLAGTEDFLKYKIEIRKDNNNSPGDVIIAYDNPDVEVIQNTEEIMGFPTYWANVTIPNNGLELPVNQQENTRYWVTIQVWSKSNNNIGILNFHRINGWLTSPTFQSLDDRATWITTTWQEDPGLESIWSFDADCSLMAVDDANADKITFYPNPVKDILNISSTKSIKEVNILSYTGQKLMTIKDVKNNQINISSLTSGNYLVNIKLESGSIKTFKIQKK